MRRHRCGRPSAGRVESKMAGVSEETAGGDERGERVSADREGRPPRCPRGSRSQAAITHDGGTLSLTYSRRRCFLSDSTGVRNSTKRVAGAVKGPAARVCDHCMQSVALVTARPAVTGLE